MKKSGKKTIVPVIAVLLVLALAAGGALFWRSRAQRFVPKRQNENEILAYQDSSTIELYYSCPKDFAPEELRVELCVGDGPIEAARAVVQPGETVTQVQTKDGEPFRHFTSGIYTGRIVVFDEETGRLKERLDALEFRIYSSCKDAYDALQPTVYEREERLDEQEYRPPFLEMRVDLKYEEIRAGLWGLFSEWRDLNSYIYAQIRGQEVLVAKAEPVPPRSVFFQLYLEPGVADMLSVGDVISAVRVDSYYADTGELYDSIPGEINEVVRLN